MGIKERKEKEKEALRKKIIDATAAILIREGHERTTIRKVAAAIEYSPRTVYLFFKDKDTLLREIIDEGFAGTLKSRANQEPRPDYARAAQAFEAQIRANIQLAMDSPNLYKAIVYLIQHKAYPAGPNQQAVIDALVSDIRGWYAYIGSPCEDAAQKADMVFAIMRGFNLMLINRMDRLNEGEIEAYRQLCIRSIMNGLLGMKETIK